jgi:hypothetical protein
MFSGVLLTLVVLTIMVGAVLFLMFTDVAFGEAKALPSGWSASGNRAASSGIDGAKLALRVEQAVGRAVARLGVVPPADAKCDTACSRREIRVTTPEALAIVAELQGQYPPAAVRAIRDQARQNLASHGQPCQCPLLMSGGFCACEQARPVACRTSCVLGADSDVEATRLAESVGAGATQVFRDCLHASGLDDAQYELNQAIVRTLDTPNAARRWAQGEFILKSTTTGV